jgi:hypothetical protein
LQAGTADFIPLEEIAKKACSNLEKLSFYLTNFKDWPILPKK